MPSEPLDRRAPPGRGRRLPRYMAAKKIIIGRLLARQWKPGERIPAEPELAREIGISVGTLRRAVSELVDEGVLVRLQGSGTYVGSFGAGRYWNRFQPFQTLDGRPLHLKERVPVRFEELPAQGELAESLQLPPGERVLHITRRITNPDCSLGLDELFLPARYFPGLTLEFFKANLDPHESLYAFYERAFGVVITETANYVSCEVCGRGTLEAIGNPIAEGTPLCCCRRISKTYGHVPVEMRRMKVNFLKVQLSFDL